MVPRDFSADDILDVPVTNIMSWHLPCPGQETYLFVLQENESLSTLYCSGSQWLSRLMEIINSNAPKEPVVCHPCFSVIFGHVLLLASPGPMVCLK